MKLCRTCKKVIPDNETWCDNPNCKEYALFIARQKLEDVSKNYTGKREALYRSKEWRLFRAKVLKERPICENCGNHPSRVVHHLSYEDPFDETQVQAICSECHTNFYGTRYKQ